MKKIIFTIGVLVSCSAYSQVGINTETPKASLDVKGNPLDLANADGIIAPRLKGSELKGKDALYTDDQKASLVYVTEPLAISDTTSKTANVTSIGYFYFDGSIWQKLNTDTGTGTSGNDWSLLGNSGTSSGFIGTTDAKDFVRKTDNVERERTYKAVNSDNTIKTITGGDLNVNGITLGKGKNNNANNTTLGIQGLFSNTTGGFNTAMGGYVLKDNTIGNSNVAIGHSSLTSNTQGGNNVGLGASTLVYNKTGGSNIAIGSSALSNISNVDGSFNIGIGFTAGNALKNGTSNNIVIGSSQQLANANGSNQLNIGGAIFGTGLSGTEAAPAGNIGIGTTSPATRLEVNNGTTNGAIKIVDGTQGEGKVLTSDANGLAIWKTPNSPTTGTSVGYSALLSGIPVNYPGNNTLVLLDLSVGSGALAAWRTNTTTLTVPPNEGGKYLLSFTSGIKVSGNVLTPYSFFTYVFVNNTSSGETPGTTIGSSNGGSYTSAIFSLSWSQILDLNAGDNITFKGLSYGTSGTPQYFRMANISLIKVE